MILHVDKLSEQARAALDRGVEPRVELTTEERAAYVAALRTMADAVERGGILDPASVAAAGQLEQITFAAIVRYLEAAVVPEAKA